MLRSTFSTTTMASSTTIPMAKTRPNKESALIENPNANMTANGRHHAGGCSHHVNQSSPQSEKILLHRLAAHSSRWSKRALILIFAAPAQWYRQLLGRFGLLSR